MKGATTCHCELGGLAIRWNTSILLRIIGIHEEVMTMQDRLLRRRQVEEITGMSRSSIYKMMQEGTFPQAVRIGPSAVRWKASDMEAWVESRPVAASDIGSPSEPWVRPS